MPVLRNSSFVGLVWALFSFFLFSIHGVCLKECVSSFPAVEIFVIRQIITFGVISLSIFFFRGGTIFVIENKTALLLRSLSGSISFCLLAISYLYLPISDVTALAFSQSIFIALLVPVVSKEIPGIRSVLSIIVGIIGVFIVVNPTGSFNLIGTTCALGAGFFEAVTWVCTRRLAKNEDCFSILFYFSVITVAIGILMLSCMNLFSPSSITWITPKDPFMLCILVLVGIAASAAQIFFTKSLAHVSPCIAAPISYTPLIWMTVLGYLLWHEKPSLSFFQGAPLIVLAGMFIFVRGNEKAVESNA